jgi:lysophospholipase L1-like esterase
MYKNNLMKFVQLCVTIMAMCLLPGSMNLSGQLSNDKKQIWVGTWSTGPQLVETRNNPPAPGLTSNSLRQVVRVSIGGEILQVKFSNEYSKSPVTMLSVQIAAPTGGSNINESTLKNLTFKGKQEVTMDPGTTVTSDPVAFKIEPRYDVAITICFGNTSPDVTGHPGSRTTSYILPGNNNSVTDFTGAVETEHWYVINGIDVMAPSTASCIAILGNSITDGRGSETNMQNRWPDLLSERLLANPATSQVGVLNLGIGGNCVLRNCLGPAGVSRYESDILDQHGVRSVIIFEGVNDIGGVRSAEASTSVFEGLIEAYSKMIESAHSRGLKIYGATITPFKGNGYYNQYSEECRSRVNEWIRNSGRFDAVFDFDLVVRNPNDPISLISSYQNDGLHPDLSGFGKMAGYIDLKLFEGSGQVQPVPDLISR